MYCGQPRAAGLSRKMLRPVTLSWICRLQVLREWLAWNTGAARRVGHRPTPLADIVWTTVQAELIGKMSAKDVTAGQCVQMDAAQ